MTWPTPKPGLVIRYSYLWHREPLTGQEEGAKERPCAVVLALQDDADRTRVYALIGIARKRGRLSQACRMAHNGVRTYP